MLPKGQTKPYKGIATAWFEASVSSPTTACITAVFPEQSPERALEISIIGRFLDKPNKIVVIAIPKIPERMTGRRPTLSVTAKQSNFFLNGSIIITVGTKTQK
jgi:hypothetical protein